MGTTDPGGRYRTVDGRLVNAHGQPLDEPANGNTKAADEFARDSDEPNEEWTVADLKAYASERDIDLDGARNKADILERVTE